MRRGHLSACWWSTSLSQQVIDQTHVGKVIQPGAVQLGHVIASLLLLLLLLLLHRGNTQAGTRAVSMRVTRRLSVRAREGARGTGTRRA